MCSVLIFTFSSDSRAAYFCKSVYVVCLDVKLVFQFFAHVFCPWLGSEEAQLQLQFINAHFLRFLNALGKIEGIGWSAGDCRGAKVLHQHKLLGSVAAAGREDGRSYPGGSVVGSEPAGEQAVAVCHLADIFICQTARSHATCCRL